jgi:UDP-GlcNAc3NAcA epimerase
MMKVVTILGARPQFIKAGTVSREILKYSDIQEVIVHTGQHYDSNMSDIFFDEMKIPIPDYFLGIGGGTHGSMTGQMLEKIEQVLIKEAPDWLLVYGDTNSTLAGAIAASKLNIKIAHIEAGLRSFNTIMPEEINRILTDRVSSFLFCPTAQAISNLHSEGVDSWNTKYILSGDVMHDGALFYSSLSTKPTNLDVTNNFVLATLHRAENTDNPRRLYDIVEAINEIAETSLVVFPMHPRTRIKLENSSVKLNSNVLVCDPVGYLNMVWLIQNCKLVMTDSGGLQKEAYFFKKQCITLRDETEWVELVDKGYNVLVGAKKEKIVSEYLSVDYSKEFCDNLYGGGNASKIIVAKLLEYNSL